MINFYLKFSFSASKTVFSKNQDILNNFTKITPLQRFNLILSNSYKAITNPHDGTPLSHLGDLVSYSALIEIKDKMKKDKIGLELLETKPRIREDINIEKMLNLPKNTFGFHYADFMKNHGYSNNERPLVKYIPDFDLAYIYQRYKEIHDFLHVLLYYDVTIHNELVIKWFEMIQLGLPSCAMSSFFGQILLSCSDLKDLYLNQLPNVMKNANDCKFIMNIYFEKEFETDIDEFRRKINLTPLK